MDEEVSDDVSKAIAQLATYSRTRVRYQRYSLTHGRDRGAHRQERWLGPGGLARRVLLDLVRRAVPPPPVEIPLAYSPNSYYTKVVRLQIVPGLHRATHRIAL